MNASQKCCEETQQNKARKITGAKKKQLDWVQKGDLTEAVSQK